MPRLSQAAYVQPLLTSSGFSDRMGHAGTGRQRAAGSVWTKGAWRAFGERTVPLPFSGDGITPKAKGAAGGAVTATVHRDGSYSVAVGGTKDSMKVHGNVDAAGDGGKDHRAEAVSMSICMLTDLWSCGRGDHRWRELPLRGVGGGQGRDRRSTGPGTSNTP